MAAEAVFLDTSLIVAASVASHPACMSSQSFVAQLAQSGAAPCVSLQVCREFMVSLTRGPIGGQIHTVAEALAALEDWLVAATLLFEDKGVQRHWERLVEKYSVRGKQMHDCNIVATMLASGVTCIATRNAVDFERYVPEGIRIIGPTTH